MLERMDRQIGRMGGWGNFSSCPMYESGVTPWDGEDLAGALMLNPDHIPVPETPRFPRGFCIYEE